MKEFSQEWWFNQWLEDAKKVGIVEYYTNSLDPITLFDGVGYTYEVPKTLYKGTKREKVVQDIKRHKVLPATTYTPDFFIVWNPDYLNKVFKEAHSPDKVPYFIAQTLSDKWFSYVDVKAPPTYGRTNASDASFATKRNWLYEKKGIFTNRVYNFPNVKRKDLSIYLFCHTFTPNRYLLTDKQTKARVISKWTPKTITEYINQFN
jgi:hypothetical protein